MVRHYEGRHGRIGILANLQNSRNRGLYLDVDGILPGPGGLLVSVCNLNSSSDVPSKIDVPSALFFRIALPSVLEIC